MNDKQPSRRQRQTQQTREEILSAARRLFAERGYTRTSVRDIAEAAGVSAQTVYDSVGATQALVARLHDVSDDEAGIPAIAGAVARSSDPTEIAATSAKITRSILEHSGDVIHALVTGAAAEPELEAVLAEGQRRHLQGATTIVGLLQRLNALDASIDRKTAVDTLAAVSDIRLALVLRENYGWSLDHIEQWIATTSQALLLARS